MVVGWSAGRVGEAEVKTNSAQLKLGLGLSLAKKIGCFVRKYTKFSEKDLKNMFFLNINIKLDRAFAQKILLLL